MEQNKNLAHNTFARAKVSPRPLQAPSPESPARSAVYGRFREREPNSRENQLHHHGITDRFEGEQTIKRWQREEIDEIDRRMREAIANLRDERDHETEREKAEWADQKAKHERLRDKARKELDVPEPKAREQDKEQDDKGSQGNRALSDVRSYVDDYIAGRGRNSAEHEQFAANHGREIEEEFQRRAKEMATSNAPEPEIVTDRHGNEIIDMSGPVEPEPSRDEPPPFEPDDYVPVDRAPPPPDMDFEIGD